MYLKKHGLKRKNYRKIYRDLLGLKDLEQLFIVVSNFRILLSTCLNLLNLMVLTEMLDVTTSHLSFLKGLLL